LPGQAFNGCLARSAASANHFTQPTVMAADAERPSDD
jgi:hypothetical protein